MVVSSGGVQEATAAIGSLCTLQVCTNIQKENIELLEMCFLRVGEQGISPQSNIKKKSSIGDWVMRVHDSALFMNRAE